MIVGAVTPSLDACVALAVRADDGSFRTYQAVVDTAFNGDVFLPEQVVVGSLGLPWLMWGRVELADGDEAKVDVHTGAVLWDGQLRSVHVHVGGRLPLVGRGLLRGHDLRVRFEAGGRVEIEALP